MTNNINLIVFVALILIGYIFGTISERRHFKSIISREHEYKDLLTFSERLPPPDINQVNSQLVGGNVVISIDRFKQVVAAIRSLVGGRVTTYESLLERARREAVLRMKEAAIAKGAKMVINVKLETASITKGAKQQVSCVEVYAYGTALIPS